MALGSLGSLVVSLALDTARFQGDLGKAAAVSEQRMRQIKSTFVNSLSGISGAFALVGVLGLARRSAEAADQMLALAERTGRTVESLSQLEYVAKRGNTSIDALIKGQEQFAKKLGATDDEGKAAAKALAELGLSADRLRALSPDQQLEAIADAMGGITNPTQRARIEMALLGKAGTELDPILRGGSEGIRALREESDALGATMTELEARRLQKLDDQLERTSAQFGKLKTEIAGVLAQPIASYFELLQKGFVGWRVMLNLTGDEMEDLNHRAAALLSEQAKLQDAQRHWDTSQRTRDRLAAIREELGLIAERQDFLVNETAVRARYEADVATLRGKQAAEVEKAAEKLKAEAKAAEDAAKAYAKFRAELAAILEHEKLMNSLELKYPTPILDDAELDRVLGGTSKMIRDQAEKDQKVLDEIYRKNAENFKESQDAMTVYAEQAARNIQGYFADFLFDPFDEGIRGMLKGFINVLRRMVAEIAAAELLKGLSGTISKVIASFLGTSTIGGTTKGPNTKSLRGLATGGYMEPSSWAIVGERGPELAVAGRGGATIIPFPRAPDRRSTEKPSSLVFSPQYDIHIDSRADRAAVYQDVVGLLRENNRQQFDTLRDMRSRGAF